MGCQGVKCSVCGGKFPACQMKDGMCAACRAKKAAEEKKK
jgi:hypothetical protein